MPCASILPFSIKQTTMILGRKCYKLFQLFHQLFSDIYTPESYHGNPKKWLFDTVGRCVSFSNLPFPGSMLVFRGVLLYRPKVKASTLIWAGLTRRLHKLAKLQDNEALTIYTQIVKNKQYPFSGRFRVNMGNIYFKQEKWTAAIKMYRMALDQIPNNVQATSLDLPYELQDLLWETDSFYYLCLSQFSDNGHTKRLRYFSFG